MRSIEELEILGWLAPPTAKINYLVNPTLQERFPTYDEYAANNYKKIKDSWNTSGLINSGNAQTINKGGSTGGGILSSREFQQETSKNQILPFTHYDNSLKNVNNVIKFKKKIYKNDYSSARITKVKPVKKKIKPNLRIINTTCPNCMSTLKVNTVKILECSGDRLELWTNEFLKFNKLDDDQKTKYLINFTNTDMFLELYDKWNYIENGRRVRFECGYSNRLFNPISRFRTSFPDPVLIKKIERSLGRPLSEKEKFGEEEIFKEGKDTFFTDYKRGRVKVKISQIVFPDGVMSE